MVYINLDISKPTLNLRPKMFKLLSIYIMKALQWD